MENESEVVEKLGPRRFFLTWAELAGFWALAIAWPIYQRLVSGTETLTGIGVRGLDLLVFVVMVSLLVPLVLALLEFGVAKLLRRSSLLRVFQAVLCGLLAALFVWQQVVSSPGLIRIVLPLAVLAAFTAGYLRTDLVRNFTGLLALATPVVIVLFALSFPIKDAILPGKEPLAAQSTDSETPVVIVVLDELPLASLLTDDHRIDRRFYPNLAALAKKSTWYRRALSVADNTLSAVPAILSGEQPTVKGPSSEGVPPGRPQYPDTVCSTAERAGYELYSNELVTDFCGRSDSLGTRLFALIEQGLPSKAPDFLPDSLKPNNPEVLTPNRIFERGIDKASRLFGAPDDSFGLGRAATFKDFTAKLPDGGRSVSVLHIALPHLEYQYLPDGRVYSNRELTDNQTVAGVTHPSIDRESAKNLQQMTSQMMYTDHLVGGLIDHMKAAGTWDDSLFILTADHGASFQAGADRRVLEKQNAGWLMPVPLFIKYPGQDSGKVVDADVDSHDIEPTALGVLGLDPSPRSTGRDLETAKLKPRPLATGVSSDEGRITLPRRTIDRLEDQAVRWRNRVFSSGRLNAIGGHGDLMGKPVSALPGLRPLQFQPISISKFDDVALNSPIPPFGLPAVMVYFQAALPGVKHDPGPLAVTLNDKVAGTSRAWKRDGVWMTAVNLDANAFREGKNPTAVYAIEGR